MAKKNETKVKFSIFNKEFNAGIQEMSAESSKLKKEFKLQSEQMKDTATATEKLETKVQYLGKQQDIVKRKVNATDAQLKKAKQTYGENSNEANKLANKLLDLQISEQRLENSINQTRSSIEKQQREMMESRSAANKFEKSLNELGQKSNDLGDKLGTGVSLPLAGVSTAAGVAAMSVHDAGQVLIGSLGATGDEAQRLKDDMQEVWNAGFGDSPEQIARSMAMVKQNIKGINSGKELQDVTKQMLTLADVTESDVSEVTRGVNQLMHNFGKTSEEAMDLFAKGQAEGLNYSQEMYDNISEYAPLFKQMGFSAEEYFSILANGAKNGAYNLDYINDIMKEFDVRVRDGSDRTVDAFAEMSDETQNLFKEFENGEATTRELFDTVIPELENMDDQVKANQIGVELFGTKWEDMGQETVYALDDVNESMQTVDGSMGQLQASQEQTFSREFKQTLRGILDALEPLGEEMLEIARDVTPHIQELSEWFTTLDTDTQKFLLTLTGSAALAGPALKTFSGLTNVLGKLSGGFGTASKSAGAAGLAGNLIKFGSKGGVVGLAIAGVAALGTTVYTLAQRQNELNDVSLETAISLQQQHDQASAMISQFDTLRNKSKLTNDQFARYVDLQSELQEASNPQVIAAIKEEMAQLEKKSGFTNGELSTMVQLNNNLVEALPGATQQITNQGNKIAGTTSELSKYNAEIEKMATLELEGQFYAALENQKQLTADLNAQQKQLNILKTREKEINTLISTYTAGELETLRQKTKEELNSLQAQQASVKAGSDEWQQLQNQIVPLRRKYDLIKDGKQGLNDQLLALKRQKNEKEKIIGETETEIAKLGMVYDKLQINYLKNAGIKDEISRQAVNQGNVTSVIKDQINKLESQKQKLRDQTPINMRNTREYRNGISAIDGQISELQSARGQISTLTRDARNYTRELGRDVSKTVQTNMSPSDYEINRRLSRPAYKTLNITTSGGGHYVNYAKGTDFHPGGPAVVGEEGPELIRQGNQWSLHDFGFIPNLQRGADVYTHEETQKMMAGINKRLPAYASGAGVSPNVSCNLDRMSTDLASGTQGTNQSITIQMKPADVIMDKRALGRLVAPEVKVELNDLQFRRGR
ncbi:phage tail tape measure protein [Halobacillus salinus]|uniref:Phage tail tape measure protein domain-containing protein n=1 Tax=Halobacillus salinus TaxID=192814 RepID=A0A4Z0H2R2_9BACI|nr:phage tail tape measure protein [Halobacillus salinus]TGB04688.1 hypothetical protein E4663_06770 [Halobacillus salinus]